MSVGKKIIWGMTFVFGAPALVIWSFVLLFMVSSPLSRIPHPQILGASTGIFAPSDSFFPEMKQSLSFSDSRVAIISNYLRQYNSPLLPYARHIVEISDKYALDYRLLVAIARQESGLCRSIPDNSFNCWGYGIYGDRVTRFDSYPQALNTVAKGLKINYIDKGLITPEQIMAKYTPPSIDKGGPWAKAINQLFIELE